MKLKLFIVIVICIFCHNMCLAENLDICNLNSDKDIVIEHSIDNALEGQRFSINIYYPPENNSTEDYEKNIFYTGENVLSQNGAIYGRFPIDNSCPAGEYKIEIFVENMVEELTGTVFFVTDEEQNKVINNIANPVGETESEKSSYVQAILNDEQNRKIIDVDFLYYDSLLDKAAVCDELVQGEFAATRVDFLNIFNQIVAARALSEAESEKQVNNILEKFSEFLLDNENDLYTQFKNSKYNSEISIKIYESEMYNKSDVINALAVNTVKAHLNNDVLRWNMCAEVLEEFNQVLNIDFEKYNASDNKQNIIKCFMESEFKNISDFKNNWDKSVDEVKKPISTDNSSGGGSSSLKTTLTKLPSIVQDSVADDKKKKAFADVDETSWAYTSINCLNEKEVMCGYGDGLFRPDEYISREEAIKAVVLALGFNNTADAIFADVESSRWSYQYICIAYKNKLIYGNDNNMFYPKKYISREQICAIIGRAICARFDYNESTENLFNDFEQIDEYAKNYVQLLYSNSIIEGNENNYFLPKDNCTRAQFSKILYNTLTTMGETE